MRKGIGSVVLVIGAAMFLRGLAYYAAALILTDLDPGYMMNTYQQEALLINQIIWQFGGTICASLGVMFAFWEDKSDKAK